MNTETATTSPSVKQFNCTSCGASLSVVHPRAREIACQYCGSVLDVNSEEHQILQKIGTPSKHEPFSFIRLGMVAELEDKHYQVIARTRWRQKYKEYWREEGESGYSNEVWVYDEWLLIDVDRTYLYLIEDREGYWISEEIIPETPMLLPRNLRMSFFQQQSDRQVQEYGGAEVIYFEGESNYQISKGDRIHFAAFDDRGISYSAEWRMVSKDQIKEIEFFKETPVSRRKLVEAFGDNEELAKLAERASRWNFHYQVARIAFLAFMALTVLTFINSGKLVKEQYIPFSDLLQGDGYLTEPFSIDKRDLYRLNLIASDLNNNAEVYVFAYVLDSTGAAINTVEGNFFYYTGYDSEGQWTEANLTDSKRFRVEETGQYRLQVFADPQAPVTNGRLNVSLYQGVMLTRYAFIAMLIALIVMIFASRRRRV